MALHKIKLIKLFALSLLVFPAWGWTANSELKKSKKGESMKNTEIYSILYANPLRNSSLPTTTTAKGIISWSQPLKFDADHFWPATILLWDQNILVATRENMTLFDKAGKNLWSKPKQSGTPVTVSFSQNKIYNKNKNLFLESFDLKGKQILKDGSFPGGLSSDVQVQLIWPRDLDFVSVLLNLDQHDHSEDGECADPNPTVKVIRNLYSTTYGDWQKNVYAYKSLPPLLNPETNILSVVSSSEVNRFDVKNDKKLELLKTPLATPDSISADQNDIYYAAGFEKSSLAVVAFDSSGKERWKWVQDQKDAKTDEAWMPQPPVLGKLRTYVLTNERLFAIEKGKLSWQVSLKTEKTHQSMASALADDSVLVANGKNLFYFDSAGKKIWSVELKQEILSPPVVDSDGNIFVATTTDLVRVN